MSRAGSPGRLVYVLCMRFVLLSLVLAGCVRGPSAVDADPVAMSLCTVGPEHSQCAVRLAGSGGAEVTALQVDLHWDPQGATLTGLSIPGHAIVHVSPPILEASGQVRIVLVHSGAPAPLAGADGVAFTAQFAASRQVDVWADDPVLTDASATKLAVGVGPGTLHAEVRP
ncbi:MAG: hypothetical protein ACI9WU_000867 [Myxococcota bacterium]|jgi:hypothetical protein